MYFIFYSILIGREAILGKVSILVDDETNVSRLHVPSRLHILFKHITYLKLRRVFQT